MECGPVLRLLNRHQPAAAGTEFVVCENTEIDRAIYCDKSGAEQCLGASRRLIELAQASREHSNDRLCTFVPQVSWNRSSRKICWSNL